MKTLVGTNDFIYRETKSRIEIMTIWDSRQDPETFDRIISKDPNQ
jgi:hypothetical protein